MLNNSNLSTVLNNEITFSLSKLSEVQEFNCKGDNSFSHPVLEPWADGSA